MHNPKLLGCFRYMGASNIPSREKIEETNDAIRAVAHIDHELLHGDKMSAATRQALMVSKSAQCGVIERNGFYYEVAR